MNRLYNYSCAQYRQFSLECAPGYIQEGYTPIFVYPKLRSKHVDGLLSYYLKFVA